MATRPLPGHGLRLQLEEGTNEAIVHCTGKINAENADEFQKQIRDLIPESRGHVTAITCRIVLDLSNVSHIDSTGLGAFARRVDGGSTKGLRPGNCQLESAGRVDITKLDTVFQKMKELFGTK